MAPVAPGQAPAPKPPKEAPKTTAAITSGDPMHDKVSLPATFHSSPIRVNGVLTNPNTDVTHLTHDMIAIENEKPVQWDKDEGLAKFVNENMPPAPPAASNALSLPSAPCSFADNSQVYVFHITHWELVKTTPQTPTTGSATPAKPVSAPARLVSSAWFAYTLHGQNELKFARLSGQGDQTVYGKKKALVIGLAGFDEHVDDSVFDNFKETYDTSVVQGTPENRTDFALLVSSIGGFAVPVNPTKGGLLAISSTTFALTVGCQFGTPKLPFALTVTDSTVAVPEDKAPSAPASGSLTCAGTDKNLTPCASTHSFGSIDKEYWDVSIGLALPGVRETKYTFTNNTVTVGKTTHTDLYGMVDFYEAARWRPKDTWIPHFAVGLPVTSQTFYRPFFGISENLTGSTGLQRKLLLPIGINVFAGLVDMKTQYLVDSPTTQAAFNTDLKHTRVWKGVFGIEVPIASMASKLGKKSSSAAPKNSASP